MPTKGIRTQRDEDVVGDCTLAFGRQVDLPQMAQIEGARMTRIFYHKDSKDSEERKGVSLSYQDGGISEKWLGEDKHQARRKKSLLPTKGIRTQRDEDVVGDCTPAFGRQVDLPQMAQIEGGTDDTDFLPQRLKGLSGTQRCVFVIPRRGYFREVVGEEKHQAR